MSSPLGVNLENAFMMEFENTLVPRLYQHIKKHRRYAI